MESECLIKSGKCKYPRLKDKSGCICDLRKKANTFNDWKIAQLVGVATYAQLLDAAPGLFTPFPDHRSDGNSSSSIISFRTPMGGCSPIIHGWICREKEIPPPPNLVSTILANGEITLGELKRQLIRASLGLPYDPYINPLIGTSKSYSKPELTLGEIISSFIIYTIIFSIIIGVIIGFFTGTNDF